ncbi:glycoside hydrolase family 133 protein [Atractiella rhizophila]|nr:glycoside hydrolase family 133 protein [Atractiella rhizophila]
MPKGKGTGTSKTSATPATPGSVPTTTKSHDAVKPGENDAGRASVKEATVVGFEELKRLESVTIYDLQLEDDGSPSKERAYIRLPAPFEPYILRFTIDAGSTASKGGILYTNFPLDGSPFERTKFHEQPLPQDFSQPIQISLPITRSGAYEFYISYLTNGSHESSAVRVRSTSGYFNVEPCLRVPGRNPILGPDGGKILKEDVNLPMDGLVIQSVIAKWMGSIDQWTPHLENITYRGYNMLHFTPLQVRGVSNSPYSIFDQLAFSKDLFKDGKVGGDGTGVEEMREFLKKVKATYGLLSLTDVVWNHTANSSKWLQDHPESGYNVVNSPHLLSALELDDALVDMSDSLATLGLPDELKTPDDLDKIMSHIENVIIPRLKLWEYYTIDVASEKDKFLKGWRDGGKVVFEVASEGETKGTLGEGQKEIPELIMENVDSLTRLEIVQAFAKLCLPKNWDKFLGARYNARVDLASALAFTRTILKKDGYRKEEAEEAAAWLAKVLDDLNVKRYEMWDDDKKAILHNIRGRIQYTRLAEHGPKLGKVTKKSCLFEDYFTRLPKNSTTAKHDPLSLSLANNGWIWNADPLVDFAGPSSRAYLRRDVIAWGDCVKLRYGSSPSDNPWLWEHMIKYTEVSAELFDGFRLDNCHSTPLHVGEKLLDAARRKNGDLYVCAELFTGSQEMDMIFVKRLGVNSLIREAMNGGDPKNQSSLLYNYGVGKPVGSMDANCLTEESSISMAGTSKSAAVIPLQGHTPHAFMMDCTHDNEAPAQKRTARDALPTGALVSFCWSAIGSNKGFDDLYPKYLNLVTDPRMYEAYDHQKKVGGDNGIGEVKRILNHLHTQMAIQGFVEGHLHQENDYIVFHRVHPITHEGFVLITHCAFKGTENQTDRGYTPDITLRGSEASLIFAYELDITSQVDVNDPKWLKGLPAQLKKIEVVTPDLRHDNAGPYTHIEIPQKFPPGSAMLFSTKVCGLPPDFDSFCLAGLKDALSELDLVDLNILLYRCDAEEKDYTNGQDGTYNIPGHGSLVYCGLQGWVGPLRRVMQYNDLGHPICDHLRKGSWALDYIVGRLEKYSKTFPRLTNPAGWFRQKFDRVKQLVPDFMRPKYFAMIVHAAFKAARKRALEQMSPFVRDGHSFTHALALTSLQMHGCVTSASIHPTQQLPSLAAGLPHFTTEWARCWGRDIGISMGGLFLMTGQFEAAKRHIEAFCSTLKHGLMPNLLDSNKQPRYNSRDSPWWILQNIQDYARYASEGTDILKMSVKRRFPKDDTWISWDDPKCFSYSSTVEEVIQEVFQRHASGIHFIEYNAGPNLDMQMSSDGFKIDIEVDWETGFIKGGNERNCGTWMDKMGESEKSGSKGWPATPRDGAPVEITGLVKSCLNWIVELHQNGLFRERGVTTIVHGKEKFVSYQEWRDLIQQNFERCYFIPLEETEDAKYSIDSSIVRSRGIYKDVYGTPAPRTFSDYQFRCNFPIAMALAPELFTPNHALLALRNVEDSLWGESQLGMKTLAKGDEMFRGTYDQQNDSLDRSIAKGWNYHQGPEWVWPLGYFLRAYLHFDTQAGQGQKDPNDTFHKLYSFLIHHRAHIRDDYWAGLPELTNEDGVFCRDSCRTQAWSGSTILEALEKVWKMQQ